MIGRGGSPTVGLAVSLFARSSRRSLRDHAFNARDQTFMAISAETKSATIRNFRRHETDTGSPETQIAILTDRIKELSGHLQQHRKDVHSRRGLMMMVSTRNRLLRYLARTNRPKYLETIQRLGLRK